MLSRTARALALVVFAFLGSARLGAAHAGHGGATQTAMPTRADNPSATEPTEATDAAPPPDRTPEPGAASVGAEDRALPTARGVSLFPRAIPPLHPILVNFTAALLPISFLCDLLGRLFRRESLKASGWWTLLFAAAITPFTALAGWLWLDRLGPMDHPEMAVHKWLGIGLAFLFLALAGWRGRLHLAGRAPGAPYLASCGVLVLTLVVQGHLGGTMSFGTGEPAAEAAPTAPAQAPPPEAAERPLATMSVPERARESEDRASSLESAEENPHRRAGDLSTVAHQLADQVERVYQGVRDRARGSEALRRLERFRAAAQTFHEELERSGDEAQTARPRFDEMVAAYCEAAHSFRGLHPSEPDNREFDTIDSLMDGLLVRFHHAGCAPRGSTPDGERPEHL